MGSFLVIGMGRFGSSIATELYRMKHDVLALDIDENKADAIVDMVTNVIIGDAKNEAVLESLSVRDFDCVVVAIASSIEDSILTTISLKEMGARRIVCKAQNDRHAKILSQIGADRVIRPEYDMGKRAAHSLTRQNIIDYLEISPEFGIIEIITPGKWVGNSIAKNDLRRKFGITVLAIRRVKTEKIEFLPTAETEIIEGDLLTVVGAKPNLDKISELK